MLYLTSQLDVETPQAANFAFARLPDDATREQNCETEHGDDSQGHYTEPMNYYKTKFAREAKAKPSDWLIDSRGGFSRLVQLPPRTCGFCDAELGPQNTTGLCDQCAAHHYE